MTDSERPEGAERAKPTPPSFKKLITELVISIVIPVLILRKFSGEEQLGPTNALLLALVFPLLLGIYDFVKEKKFALVPTIGFISILLTGGIGVLKLPKEYIAIKEALVPLGFGLGVLFTIIIKKPLIKTLFYNDMLMDTAKIGAAAEQQGRTAELEQAMINATWIIVASFILSSVLNYVLAKIIIVSETGTEAFNQEFGTLTAISYPAIALPSMIVTISAMIYVVIKIKKITGLELEDVFHQD